MKLKTLVGILFAGAVGFFIGQDKGLRDSGRLLAFNRMEENNDGDIQEQGSEENN